MIEESRSAVPSERRGSRRLRPEWEAAVALGETLRDRFVQRLAADDFQKLAVRKVEGSLRRHRKASLAPQSVRTRE